MTTSQCCYACLNTFLISLSLTSGLIISFSPTVVHKKNQSKFEFDLTSIQWLIILSALKMVKGMVLNVKEITDTYFYYNILWLQYFDPTPPLFCIAIGDEVQNIMGAIF